MKEDTYQGYKLPPAPYICFAMQHCPKASWLYVVLWNKKDANSQIKITFDEVRDDFSLATFGSNLRFLSQEGLVSYRKKADCFYIEVTAWDEEEEYDDIA